MNQKRVIGLSGVARAGKDTFALILENKFLAAGKTVEKISLAGPLKLDCQKFLHDTLNISALTQVKEEKDLIRPLFVWYGDAQRKRTNGRYWIDKATTAIKRSTADVCIITDVRYDFYENDEVSWLKNEMKGLLCHVTRYHQVGASMQYVLPANSHEEANDPKVRAAADYSVVWKSVGTADENELLSNPYLIGFVDGFVQKYQLI